MIIDNIVKWNLSFWISVVNLLIAELKDYLLSVVEFVMLCYELLTEAC